MLLLVFLCSEILGSAPVKTDSDNYPVVLENERVLVPEYQLILLSGRPFFVSSNRARCCGPTRPLSYRRKHRDTEMQVLIIELNQ